MIPGRRRTAPLTPPPPASRPPGRAYGRPADLPDLPPDGPASAAQDLKIYSACVPRYHMYRLGTIKEVLQLFTYRRKFYMFPIVFVLLIAMGITVLAQSGLGALVYPI